jgi:hypothetical protein
MWHQETVEARRERARRGRGSGIDTQVHRHVEGEEDEAEPETDRRQKRALLAWKKKVEQGERVGKKLYEDEFKEFFQTRKKLKRGRGENSEHEGAQMVLEEALNRSFPRWTYTKKDMDHWRGRHRWEKPNDL